MIFNSLSFLVFCILFFTIYSYLKGRSRLYFILCSSYFFYAWWDWRYLGLIIVSTLVDYYAARAIDRDQNDSRRKLYLILSIATNLGILFSFKYFNFFAHSLYEVFEILGFMPDRITLNVLLPVGISFYTFQSMSYTIDVYQKRIPCEQDIICFANFVAFFPQLVAGPIERAGNIIPQLKMLKGPSNLQLREGCTLVLWGYFLKVFIADNISRVSDRLFAINHLEITSLEVIIAVLAFSLQIYGDFAGYSKIARGIAKFFGIDLMMNFNHPYFARNPSDFWRRWHISLSRWLRDYLFIPLGGSQKGNWLTLRNLMITMVLGGLWHGASWVFVLWGLYHGILLIVYHCFRLVHGSNNERGAMNRMFATGLMFLCTMYGWLIFRSDSVAQLKAFTFQMFNNIQLPENLLHVKFLYISSFWLTLFYCIVFTVDILQEKRQTDLLLKFHRTPDYILALIMLFSIVFFGGRSEAFIYFQF